MKDKNVLVMVLATVFLSVASDILIVILTLALHASACVFKLTGGQP